MVNRSGTRQSRTTIGKRLVADVRAKNLTGMSQQIVYNIPFSLGSLRIFLTAVCEFVTQTVNGDSANPLEPVTDQRLVFVFFLFVVGIVILVGGVVNPAVREDSPRADSG